MNHFTVFFLLFMFYLISRTCLLTASLHVIKKILLFHCIRVCDIKMYNSDNGENFV